MEKQLDLGAFLREQETLGTKDSEGDFTVSHTNAQRKLARFRLPRRWSWVPKLVQAAVGWDMKQVLVGQSVNETQFFLWTENTAQLPTENKIVSTMLSGKVAADTPIEHFCVALRALVEQAKLSFILTINDGESTPKPIYAGKYYGKISEDARLGQRYNRGPGVTLSIYHVPDESSDNRLLEILGLHGHGSKVVGELRTYCYSSPIPIAVDGRRIDGFLSSRGHRMGNEKRPILFSGVVGLEHSPKTVPLPEKYGEAKFSLFTHPHRAERKEVKRKDFAAAYVLSLDIHRQFETLGPRVTRRSTFRWLRDGVLVHTVTLPIDSEILSVTIYANAHGLKTDLTGFQLVEEQEKWYRQAEVYERVAEELEKMERPPSLFYADRDDLSPADDRYERRLNGRAQAKKFVLGSGAALVLGVANPVLGVAAALGGFAAFASARRGMEKWEEQLLKLQDVIERSLGKDLESFSVKLREMGENLRRNGPAPESISKDSLLDILPENQLSVDKLFLAYEDRPMELLDVLRGKVEEEPSQPRWLLHLARACRANRLGTRATVYYEQYLKKEKDGSVEEELDELYLELKNQKRTRKGLDRET